MRIPRISQVIENWDGNAIIGFSFAHEIMSEWYDSEPFSMKECDHEIFLSYMGLLFNLSDNVEPKM